MRNLMYVLGTIVAMLICVLALGMFYMLDELKRKWKVRQKEVKLSEMLAGQSLEDVLAEAPYGYAHFQGEDGYRIYDWRNRDSPVGFAASTLDAHLWIVEHYLASFEKNRLWLAMRSCLHRSAAYPGRSAARPSFIFGRWITRYTR